MGKYSEELSKLRASMSSEQIRSQKCSRKRTNHELAREHNKRAAELAMATRRPAHEQLALLDARFGKGKGAAKERKKLAERMEQEKAAVSRQRRA